MENIASSFSAGEADPRQRADTSFNGGDTEADGWVLVRKNLLEMSKFSKVLGEISEAEWLRSRAGSLRSVLECCSNYHGGPTGEMWDDVTSTVKIHMGPQHEFTTLISDYQESLWTTCSLVTVSALSEDMLDESLDEKGKWEESDMQMSMSGVSVPAHKAYGSIDLIEPSGKDGRRVCMHHFNWKWLLLYIPLTLLLAGVIATAVTLADIKPENVKTVETLEGTTVYLDTQKSVWYEGWEVQDCSPSGGSVLNNYRNRTVSNVQLLDSVDLVYYVENVLEEDMEGYQSSALLKTLNGPLYLLSGSTVEYKFCLSSNFSSPQRHEQFSEFLIFNDILSYANFIHEVGNRGKEAAIFYKETPIEGISIEESCTTVTFKVSQADYYFTMYKLPPNVELHYTANIHVVYLNYTQNIAKEEAKCNIEHSGSCTINIPDSMFSTDDYTILAYIPLQTDTAPNTTQLCVTPKQSLLVAVIPGVISAIVLVLLTVVLVCQIISFAGNVRRRKGYFCIKPINV